MRDIARIDQIRDDAEERRRCRSVTPVTPPDALISEPYELVPRDVTPNSIAEWKAVADGFLTDESCAFHRNVEISSRYAWLYKLMPACFKWAGMAAIASHHVRLALFPLRLDADRTGYVNIPHSLVRRRMLMDDVHVIRATNNAIFGDIFWAHLAYASAEDGIERLRALLRPEPHYAPMLSGFEAIDLGRRVLEDGTASARLDGPPVISSGRATSSSSSMSSAPWCNPTSIASRARSPGSSRSAPPRGSRSAGCGMKLRSSPRSTSPHSPVGSGTLGVDTRGRGSAASMTAGVGSWRASFPASARSMTTCA